MIDPQSKRPVTSFLKRHAAPGLFAAVVLALVGALAWRDPAGVQYALLQDPQSVGRSLAPSRAERHMVAAANGLAAEAGREMLRAGGTAIDAAIATQLVLNLVEPQSSGIGGGAFVLYWDAAAKQLKAFDGRETAPASATPDRFLLDGSPMPFADAVLSGLSIGVPGVVQLLQTVHRRYGKLPWAQVFEPAIKLAENGFEISPRQHELLTYQRADNFVPAARRYFFDADDKALPVGFVRKNPELAETLRRIASKGADEFYRGATAEAIVKAVAEAPRAAGGMTLADLAGYEARERAPLCFAYRAHRICGMGPPSSGAMTVAQTLKIVEPFALGNDPGAALQPHALHLIAEAEKLAYADRDRYLADPDFVAIPDGLLDPAYLEQRRALLDPLRAMETAAPGLPPGLARQSFGIDATVESAGTSHISIVDGYGNALAMTTTIEGAFGSHNWAAGFLLNNELTDFSFSPVDAHGRPVANAVGPRKRPRSSMAPTIVFDAKGNVVAVLGSPGGSRIILYVVKSLIALLDWGMDAQAAADLLNFGSLGRGFDIEIGGRAAFAALGLKSYGHRIKPEDMTSGTHIVVRRGGHLEGGADRRREGAAVGD